VPALTDVHSQEKVSCLAASCKESTLSSAKHLKSSPVQHDKLDLGNEP
jgi:hypothetical protein